MGEGSGDFRASMARHSFVRIAFIAAVAAIAVVLVFLSLTVGTRDLSMGEVFRLFIDHLSPIRKQLIKGKLNNIIKGKVSCDYRTKGYKK